MHGYMTSRAILYQSKLFHCSLAPWECFKALRPRAQLNQDGERRKVVNRKQILKWLLLEMYFHTQANEYICTENNFALNICLCILNKRCMLER